MTGLPGFLGRLRRVAEPGPPRADEPVDEPGALSLRPSATPPGSRRVAHRFFDDYPHFYDTSETSPQPWRLNLRYEAIFREHADLFAGARVLDIASHDGRWSFAALRTGAAHVVGVEARPELVEAATANLTSYDAAPESFDFLTGDVFTVLAQEQVEVDVALCLGFFYHTLRYNELWTRLRGTGARHILIDTLIEPHAEGPVIRLAHEPVSRQGNAVPDDFSFGDQVMTGRPTLPALRLMGRMYGYSLVGTSDWAALLRDNPEADGIGDYRQGRRVTVLYRAQDQTGAAPVS